MQQALGLIETVGLAAAVEGADAAVKAANVQLLGYELTKGGGMVTIKLAGDVGAVQAAVAAGALAASRVGRVVSKLIIPRPHEDLAKIITTSETVGAGKKTKKPEEPSGQENHAPEDGGEEKTAPEDVPVANDAEEPPAETEQSGQEEAAPAERETGPEPAAAEESTPETKPAQVADRNPPQTGEYGEQVLPLAAGGEAASASEVCNLCGDPACPRRKGEPRVRCIHYEE